MDFFKFSDLLCDSYPYRITTWWLNLLYRQFEKWVVTVDGDWWENWRQNCWKIFICLHFHPEVRVVFDGNFRMHHFLQKCQEIFNDVDVLFTSEIFIIWIFRFQKPLKRYIQILPIFCNNARKNISLISVGVIYILVAFSSQFKKYVLYPLKKTTHKPFLSKYQCRK